MRVSHEGRFIAFVFAVVCAVVACSSSDPSTNWNALPRCHVANGDTLSSPAGALCYPDSAAGGAACSSQPECGLCSYVPCPGGGGAGFAYLRCDCASGSWNCQTLSQDASACPPNPTPPMDAGE